MKQTGFVLILMVLGIRGLPAAALEFLTKQTVSTKGPEVLNRAVGARASGLGGAGVAMTEDASAVYWNPAALNLLPRSEALFTHESGFAGERLDTLALARPVWWKDRRSTFGLGVTYLSQDSFDLREEDQSLGQASPYDLVGSLSFAQPWGKGAMGFTGKYIHQHLFSSDARAFALDVGAAFTGSWWRMGGSVVNVGTRLKGSGQSVGLPMAIKGGAAARVRSNSKGQVWVVLQADVPADDQLSTHAGVEYRSIVIKIWEVAFRGGYQQNGLGEGPSIGFGLGKDSWGLNYAFQMQEDLGDSHRLDLRMRFGNPLVQEEKREALLSRVHQELSEGRLLQARDTVGELRTLYPRDPTARDIHRDLERRFSESIDPQTLFLQGFHSFNAGEFSKAVDSYEKLVVVDPHFPEAKDWLAKSREKVEAARIKRWEIEVGEAKAKKWTAQKTEALRAESVDQWEVAARLWGRGLEEAMSAQESRQGLARCREALLDRSDLAESRGDLDLALSSAKAALAIGDSSKEVVKRVARLERMRADHRSKSAQVKYTEGAEAYRVGDWQRAQRLFQQALELAPNDRTYQRALDRLNAEKRAP